MQLIVQRIDAAIELKGGNACLHNKGGLNFGVWVSYYANEYHTGGEIIVEPTMEESAAEIIVNERTQKGLKYELLSILDLPSGYLTVEEKEYFWETLDFSRMPDYVMEYWQTLFDADA